MKREKWRKKKWILTHATSSGCTSSRCSGAFGGGAMIGRTAPLPTRGRRHGGGTRGGITMRAPSTWTSGGLGHAPTGMPTSSPMVCSSARSMSPATVVCLARMAAAAVARSASLPTLSADFATSRPPPTQLLPLPSPLVRLASPLGMLVGLWPRCRLHH